MDFSAAVDAEQARTVYVFQPRLDGNEALLARALKATWFEAILSSRKRMQHGNRMPLAAYIADEFHRFITSDKVHGEQSFLDTCRSFGVCCVLACQSISSMEHALEEEGDSWLKNKAALEILLNNTANKFFFPVHRSGAAGIPGPPVPACARLRPAYPGAPAIDPATRRMLRLAQ